MITACTTTNLTQTCFYHSVALYLRRSACKQNLVMSVHSVVVVIGINGWNKQLPPPPPPTPLRPPLITLRKAYYQNSTYLEYCVPHLLPAPKYHRNVKLDLIVFHLVLDFFFPSTLFTLFFVLRTRSLSLGEFWINMLQWFRLLLSFVIGKSYRTVKVALNWSEFRIFVPMRNVL